MKGRLSEQPVVFWVLSIAIIVVLGIIVFANSLSNSFHFDDFPTIVDNPAIRNLFDLRAIWGFWPTRFVNLLSLAFNYHFGGLNVEGYHILSVAIHIATALVVMWFVFLLTQTPRLKHESIVEYGRWVALMAGLIFLCHPLQTQPVNYIVQRSTLWAGLFYVLTLAVYLRARLADKSKSGIQWEYGGVWLFGILCLFSKESAISLPVMIVLIDAYLFNDRLLLKRGKAWVFLALLAIIPLTWLLTHPVDFSTSKKVLEEAYAGGVTSHDYFLTQLRVLVLYLKLLVLPHQQSVDYDITISRTLFEISVLGSLLLLSALILMAILWNRAKKGLLAFGVGWFFITLFPESSFWPNKDLMFEHRLYLPMVGFSVVLASLPFYLSRYISFSLAIRLLVMVVLIYGVVSFQRNRVWIDELTLWDNVLQQFPRDQRAYLNRGAAYQAKNDLDRALADYNMVIGLGPVTAVTLSNRGAIFKAKGDITHALANYELAIKINTNYAGTYINRGLLYLELGKFDLALNDFNEVVYLLPRQVIGYYHRGQLFLKLRQYQKANDDFSRALAIDPYNKTLLFNRVIANFLSGQPVPMWQDIKQLQSMGVVLDSTLKQQIQKRFPTLE